MTWEEIVRRLLQGRACICGVAKDSNEAYKLLAADLERLVALKESNG